MFIFSAYVADSLKMLLIFIVGAIMLCSILSEAIVMKTLNIFNVKSFIGEIVMTVVFIFSTMVPSQIMGMWIYSMAVGVFLFLNRKSIQSVLAR